ncbi:hypothetical protein [Roseofilum casamattae]|nr:hypothetical protein [Roseofilum casamattae]
MGLFNSIGVTDMIFFLIVFAILVAWWTQEILGEKPKKKEEEKKKTSAQKLGEALGEYLNDGIKIRVEIDQNKDKT